MGRWLDTQETPTFALRAPYFESTRVEDTVEKDGIRMTFRGWTSTLEDYAVALEDAGFAIETIRTETDDRQPLPAVERTSLVHERPGGKAIVGAPRIERDDHP